MNVGRTESTKDTWLTPELILSTVRSFNGGPIDLDPCTNDNNPTKALNYFTVHTNGLRYWSRVISKGLVFFNPPFPLKQQYLACAEAAYHDGLEVIGLLAANTGAKWYRRYCSPQLSQVSAVAIVNSRLKFLDPETGLEFKDPAMFDVALPYWGDRPLDFEEHFAPFCDVYIGSRGYRGR